MDIEGFKDWLMEQEGVIRVETIPDDILGRIEQEESAVVSMFGTPVKNSGLSDCLSKNTVLVAFTDDCFREPPGITMVLWNSKDEMIGRNVPPTELSEFQKRNDVVFISEDFVLFADKDMGMDPYMELRSVGYHARDGSVPEGIQPRIWFPSTTSSMILFEHFQQPVGNLGTAMIAFDL